MRLKAWSYSAVGSLLDGCGWQFYLERFARQRAAYDHPRAAVGTAFHAAVEAHERTRQRWWYTGGRQGSRDGIPMQDMVGMLKGELRATSCNWMVHDLAVSLAEASLAVRHWWEAPIPAGQPGEGGSLRDRVMGWRPVAVEQRFSFHTGRSARPLRGAADTVYLDDSSSVVVVDLKQARNYGRYPLDGSKNRLQAAPYSLACVLAGNLPGRRSAGWPAVEFHIARVTEGSNSRFQGVRVVRVDVDDEDVALLHRRLALADADVAAGRFDKAPDWFLCAGEWCPFHPDSKDPANRGTCRPDGPPEWPVDVVGEPLPMMVP